VPPAVLLDSSFVIAWHNTRDVHHAAAARTMVQLLGGEWGTLLLLEYVLLEVVTVLRARRSHDVALRVADQLLGAREVQFVSCSEYFLEALETFRRESADLNFTDAALVTVARRHKRSRIATFDDDFKGLPGITVVPG